MPGPRQRQRAGQPRRAGAAMATRNRVRGCGFGVDNMAVLRLNQAMVSV